MKTVTALEIEAVLLRSRQANQRAARKYADRVARSFWLEHHRAASVDKLSALLQLAWAHGTAAERAATCTMIEGELA